jgi:hypothetical protein
MGAQLNFSSLLPPIHIFALYRFPASTGPFALNTRIHTYLQDRNNITDPQTWQLQLFKEQVQLISDIHPDAYAFIAGDLNLNYDKHQDDDAKHKPDKALPIINLLQRTLGFDNLLVDAERTNPPVYELKIKTYRESWIDHILSKGPIVKLQAYNTSLYTYSDHQIKLELTLRQSQDIREAVHTGPSK